MSNSIPQGHAGRTVHRRLRVSKACDFCHKRKVKCKSSDIDPERCQNCIEFDLVCIFSRPWRRGGRRVSGAVGDGLLDETAGPSENNEPPLHQPNGTETASESPQWPTLPGQSISSEAQGHQWQKSPALLGVGISQSSPAGVDELPLSPAWTAFAKASYSFIRNVSDAYFDTVYPIFPFFDQQHLRSRIEQREHEHSRGFFCSVMAACALASARIRDGALSTFSQHVRELLKISPESYFAAAEESMPRDLLQANNFDYLRATAILAIASIQDGKIDSMQKYIGIYFTIMAIRQWHDESYWPASISLVEREERRRLYWSIYTLDIYSSIVWDGCCHFQEAHAKVEYPSALSEARQQQAGSLVPACNWMQGWNFTTDLYRILEHAVSRLRTRSSSFNLLEDFPATPIFPGYDILQKVNDMYSALPFEFKELRPATGNRERDIYGFQAANIQATLALLRMVFFSVEVDADVGKKCAVVSEVLSTFHNVPIMYLKGISTPLIYHLAGIGTILGSVMEAPLSVNSYRQVRELLLSMASLLETLEAFLHRSAGAGGNLREQVGRIDAYMASQQENQAQPQLNGEYNNNLQATGSASWNDSGINELSPQFQLPTELLQDWSWPFDVSQNYLLFSNQ